MNYRELTAPDLVKQWRKIVNKYVQMGRDAHLLKEFLLRATPIQILLGMYQYQGERTVSIPQFLKSEAVWLEEDEQWAEICLATYITSVRPPEYYEYLDFCEEQTADAFIRSLAARLKLKEWAEKVLA